MIKEPNSEPKAKKRHDGTEATRWNRAFFFPSCQRASVPSCRLFIAAVVVLLTMALSGCNAKHMAGRQSTYETIGDASARDTQTARRLDAKAQALIDEQKFDKAEALLKRALAADVTFGPAHNNLGKVYFHQSRLYLAAWEFQYAAKLMPHHPEPHNNLGLVFESVGKIDEAIDWYGRARDLEPDNPQLIGNLARGMIKRGDRDDTVQSLLEELLMKDDRLQWVVWARQRLALMGQNE